MIIPGRTAAETVIVGRLKPIRSSWYFMSRYRFRKAILKRSASKGPASFKRLFLKWSLSLKEYKRVEGYVGEILVDEDYWEAVGLKISARNRLKGVVKEVEKGVVAAKVRIEINTPAVVTALISQEAVEELDIKPGNNVEAVIKATEVMVAKERE